MASLLVMLALGLFHIEWVRLGHRHGGSGSPGVHHHHAHLGEHYHDPVGARPVESPDSFYPAGFFGHDPPTTPAGAPGEPAPAPGSQSGETFLEMAFQLSLDLEGRTGLGQPSPSATLKASHHQQQRLVLDRHRPASLRGPPAS